MNLDARSMFSFIVRQSANGGRRKAGSWFKGVRGTVTRKEKVMDASGQYKPADRYVPPPVE
jgi:hypothetical protein